MEQVKIMLGLITAIILIAWIIGRLAIRRTSTRDFVWRTALLLVTCAPLIVLCRPFVADWQWLLPIGPVKAVSNLAVQLPAIDRPSLQKNVPLVRQSRPHLHGTGEFVLGAPATSPPNDSSDFVIASQPTAPSLPATTRHAPRITWITLAAVIWIAGSLFQLMLIGRSLHNSRRLLRQTTSVDDPDCRQLMQRTAQQVGLRQAPRLTTSPAVTSPVVVGIFRPHVVVPDQLLAVDARHDLRAVLLHECGHVRRGDLGTELLLRLVLATIWFHPLIHLLAFELRRSREELCDNFVLADESPVNYAETLLRVAIGQQLNNFLLLGIGIVSPRNRLESRVATILSPTRSIETAANRRVRLGIGVVAASLVAAGILVRITPSIAAPESRPESAANQPQAEAAQPNVPQQAAGKSEMGVAIKQKIDKLREVFQERPIEITFRIVDAQDQPVAGARVVPGGASAHNGASFAFEASMWTTTESDAEGLVRIALPAEVAVHSLFVNFGPSALSQLNHILAATPNDPLQTLKRLGIDGVFLEVDHPNHPVWSELSMIRADATVKLSDSTTLIVRSQRTGQTGLADRVVPWLSGSRSTDWSVNDGVIAYRRVDLSTYRGRPLLRVVQLADSGPAWFSRVVDLKHITGNPVELNLPLQPGVRITGRLAADAPRPIKQGRVIGTLVHLFGTETYGSAWNVAAQVAEDGSFVFDSVPPNETLQLIALCEGWYSTSPTLDELQAYQSQYNFPRERTSAAGVGQVHPQLIHIDSANRDDLVVPMSPSTTCEVTTVDAQNRPVPGVRVQFFAHHVLWHAGTRNLGSSNDSMTHVRQQLLTGKHDLIPTSYFDQIPLEADTDEAGHALITGLPCPAAAKERRAMFFATHDKFHATTMVIPEMPMFLNRQFLGAELSPGQLTRVTVRMEPIADLMAEVAAVADEANPAEFYQPDSLEMSGHVEDDHGKPLADVKVLLGSEDCFNIRTDADGNFRYQFDETWKPADGEPQTIPLQFVKHGFAPLFRSVRLGTHQITARLQRNTWFEGVVRKPDGTAAANVPVRAYGEVYDRDLEIHLTTKSETATDADGRYQLFVQQGEFRVTAGDGIAGAVWLPEQKSQEPGERTKIGIGYHEQKTLDIALKPSVDLIVEFRDRATGQPVPDAYLFIDDDPGNEASSASEEAHKSDSAGIVRLPALPIGRYHAQINAKGYLQCYSDATVTTSQTAQPGFTPADQGLTLDLKAGMNPVRIQVAAGVAVSGVVRDPDGNPVPNAKLYLGFDPTTADSVKTRWYGHQADDQGQFRFDLPEWGDRRLHLVAYEQDDSKTKKWASGVSNAFVLQAGQPVENMEVRLTAPATIRGRIVDPDGKPMAAVRIAASHGDRLEKPNFDSATTCHRDGTFELRGLRPGPQQLHGERSSNTPDKVRIVQQVDVAPGEARNVGDVVMTIEESK